jgi:serine/threonine-protein kinase
VEGTPFGRYQLVELLGRGGMGEVWRALDTETNYRTVAIKVLPPHLADDATFAQRFRREADAAARLNNPHIIPIHTYGEIGGRLYVDMRLIEGRDLQQVLTDGPLQPSRAVRIIEQVAKALHAAHKVGLVHRDVKPSNVLLDDDDFAYLIDFGIARAADDTRMTGTGNTIGTFLYMAPERLTERPDEDARADIYALACVLYECLTGQPPFAMTSVGGLVAAHLNTPPPKPSQSAGDAFAQFDGVIAKGMAKDPDRRYPTTIELASAARAASASTLQPPLSAPSQPTRTAPTVRTLPPVGPGTSAGVSGSAATQYRAPAGTPPDSYLPPAQSIPAPESPKRSLWRVRVVVPALLAMILVAAGMVLAANQLSRPSGDAGASTKSSARPTGIPATGGPTPGDEATVKPVKAVVFSPEGETDAPEEARFAIDGNSATVWPTDTYTEAVPFPGFKIGVGLILELPQPTELSAVIISVSSIGTVVQIRSAQSSTPTTLAETTELTPPTLLARGPNTISVDTAAATSNVLVWISTLGTTDGENRAEISDITLKAR